MDPKNEFEINLTMETKTYKLRSSLKKSRSRNPCNSSDISDGEDTTTVIPAQRRVSFAASNYVKPFVDDPEKNTIWDNTYEEEVNHTDSTKSDNTHSTNLTQGKSITSNQVFPESKLILPYTESDNDHSMMDLDMTLRNDEIRNDVVEGGALDVSRFFPSNADVGDKTALTPLDMEFTCQWKNNIIQSENVLQKEITLNSHYSLRNIEARQELDMTMTCCFGNADIQERILPANYSAYPAMPVDNKENILLARPLENKMELTRTQSGEPGNSVVTMVTLKENAESKENIFPGDSTRCLSTIKNNKGTEFVSNQSEMELTSVFSSNILEAMHCKKNDNKSLTTMGEMIENKQNILINNVVPENYPLKGSVFFPDHIVPNKILETANQFKRPVNKSLVTVDKNVEDKENIPRIFQEGCPRKDTVISNQSDMELTCTSKVLETVNHSKTYWSRQNETKLEKRNYTGIADNNSSVHHNVHEIDQELTRKFDDRDRSKWNKNDISKLELQNLKQLGERDKVNTSTNKLNDQQNLLSSSSTNTPTINENVFKCHPQPFKESLVIISQNTDSITRPTQEIINKSLEAVQVKPTFADPKINIGTVKQVKVKEFGNIPIAMDVTDSSIDHKVIDQGRPTTASNKTFSSQIETVKGKSMITNKPDNLEIISPVKKNAPIAHDDQHYQQNLVSSCTTNICTVSENISKCHPQPFKDSLVNVSQNAQSATKRTQGIIEQNLETMQVEPVFVEPEVNTGAVKRVKVRDFGDIPVAMDVNHLSIDQIVIDPVKPLTVSNRTSCSQIKPLKGKYTITDKPSDNLEANTKILRPEKIQEFGNVPVAVDITNLCIYQTVNNQAKEVSVCNTEFSSQKRQTVKSVSSTDLENIPSILKKNTLAAKLTHGFKPENIEPREITSTFLKPKANREILKPVKICQFGDIPVAVDITDLSIDNTVNDKKQTVSLDQSKATYIIYNEPSDDVEIPCVYKENVPVTNFAHETPHKSSEPMQTEPIVKSIANTLTGEPIGITDITGLSVDQNINDQAKSTSKRDYSLKESTYVVSQNKNGKNSMQSNRNDRVDHKDYIDQSQNRDSQCDLTHSKQKSTLVVHTNVLKSANSDKGQKNPELKTNVFELLAASNDKFSICEETKPQELEEILNDSIPNIEDQPSLEINFPHTSTQHGIPVGKEIDDHTSKKCTMMDGNAPATKVIYSEPMKAVSLSTFNFSSITANEDTEQLLQAAGENTEPFENEKWQSRSLPENETSKGAEKIGWNNGDTTNLNNDTFQADTVLRNIESKLVRCEFPPIACEEINDLISRSRDLQFKMENLLLNLKFPNYHVIDLEERYKKMSLPNNSSEVNSSESMYEVMESGEDNNCNETILIELSLHEKIVHVCGRSNSHLSIKHFAGNSYIFKTLNDCLMIYVHIHLEDGRVTTVKTVSTLEDSADNLARFVMKIIMEKLEHSTLKSYLGPYYDVLSLLDHICLTVDEVEDFNCEFQSLQKLHSTLMIHPDFSISFEILHMSPAVWWAIKFEMASMSKINSESLQLESKWGILNHEHIKQIIRNVDEGVEFLRNFISNVISYFERTHTRYKVLK